MIRAGLASRRHPVLRLAGMVHVARRRSPRRSARRAAHHAPHARDQRPGCDAHLADELGARERAALSRHATAVRISRGRVSAMCCRTFPSLSRTSARSRGRSSSPPTRRRRSLARTDPSSLLSKTTVVPAVSLSSEVARIPAGAPYVMTLLTPPPEKRLDEADLAAALRSLTGGDVPARAPRAFELIAGIRGQPPNVSRSEDRPFRMSFALQDEPFTVRMDAWLPFDTFRRPGFGHVLRGREHVQILERGVNLVWIGSDGRSSAPCLRGQPVCPRAPISPPWGHRA